jgi:hypothetical protein
LSRQSHKSHSGKASGHLGLELVSIHDGDRGVDWSQFLVDPAHEKRLVAPARWHLIGVDGENQGANAVGGSKGRLIRANKSERWEDRKTGNRGGQAVSARAWNDKVKRKIVGPDARDAGVEWRGIRDLAGSHSEESIVTRLDGHDPIDRALQPRIGLGDPILQIENSTDADGCDNVGQREEFLSIADREVVLTWADGLGSVVLEKSLDCSNVDLLLRGGLLDRNQIVDVPCISCSAPCRKIGQPNLEEVGFLMTGVSTGNFVSREWGSNIPNFPKSLRPGTRRLHSPRSCPVPEGRHQQRVLL